MTLERYSHVMHLTSQVSGDLVPGQGPDRRAAGDACRRGPSPGAPKVRAMQIIDDLEPTKRGPYAGVVGYFDFSGNLDTAISIRTMFVGRRRPGVGAGRRRHRGRQRPRRRGRGVQEQGRRPPGRRPRRPPHAGRSSSCEPADRSPPVPDTDDRARPRTTPPSGSRPASSSCPATSCGWPGPTPPSSSRASCRRTWSPSAPAPAPGRCCCPPGQGRRPPPADEGHRRRLRPRHRRRLGPDGHRAAQPVQAAGEGRRRGHGRLALPGRPRSRRPPGRARGLAADWPGLPGVDLLGPDVEAARRGRRAVLAGGLRGRAHRGRRAGDGPGAERVDDPRGGRHRRPVGQLHQGLLHRPGAASPASTPAAATSPAAFGASSLTGDDAAPARRHAPRRRQGGRAWSPAPPSRPAGARRSPSPTSAGRSSRRPTASSTWDGGSAAARIEALPLVS